MYLLAFGIGFIAGICSVVTWALMVSTSREEARRLRKHTNADSLREMDEKELAVYLNCPYGEIHCEFSEDFDNGKICCNCKKEWLEKEAVDPWERK